MPRPGKSNWGRSKRRRKADERTGRANPRSPGPSCHPRGHERPERQRPKALDQESFDALSAAAFTRPESGWNASLTSFIIASVFFEFADISVSKLRRMMRA